MRYVLLVSLLFLASCTAGTNTTKPTTTKPTATETRTVATPTYGSGKMQVEIFADFQCPACIAANESIMPIFEEYAASGKLTITFRQFPLTSIHKNAKSDAIAALCSAEGGKYMEYKKALYALEKSKASKTVTDTERVALAKWIGLDEAKFATCLGARAFEKQVESDMALGESRGVNGTPTIFLDGIKLDMSLFKDLNGFRSFLESRMK
jgi:protein-disulfide isomerase